uniref:Hexosyltransferase n=1 Tax=Brugia malayi TaxID=6279 RepID=A0A0J9XMG6_BRUMA|nr:Bm1127 [Brugia malayi]
MVTISSKLLSAETFENGKLKTSTEAINTFNCSNNMELYNRYACQWKIIDKNFCSQKYPNLLLLIFAITAVEQREHRNLIRKTWGNIRLYEDFKTVVLFPLGITDDLDMMNLIQNEQQKYGDIIQQEFFDTYKNLTIKNYGRVNRYDTKWPVSYKEYPMQYYPRHCSGSFYLLTGYLARLLFEQARFCTLFWHLSENAKSGNKLFWKQ